MDLAWEPLGGQFKSSMDHRTEWGLVAGEVPVHFLETVNVPLGKAPNT